jgi:hypothetical protein
MLSPKVVDPGYPRQVSVIHAPDEQAMVLHPSPW